MRAILALLLLLAPQMARAEWHEAQSTHFVIYADDDERNIRRFSERLERFHAALANLTPGEDVAPSPSNRVTVFVLDSRRQVGELAGDRMIGGFYIPRAGASVAFVPQVQGSAHGQEWGMTVLLHEYTHHFLHTHSAFPYPRWMGEGAAEFFASATFPSDGGLRFGLPATHRYFELANEDVHVTDLFDPVAYAARGNRRYDGFYGKSWALYHLLTFEEERRGQMARYAEGIMQGLSSPAAAAAAFGDPEVLEREVYRYVRRRSLLGMVYTGAQLATGPITIRRMREGEAAMMEVRITSRRGVTRAQALELLTNARAIAASHPDDPAVLAALAEAEYDAGNDAEAIAAATRAVELDPGQVNAYVQHGFALFRQAGNVAAGPERIAAFRAAARPFVALNRIENDHPLPLFYFHQSYAQSGREIPQMARDGLARAVELAPFDLGLRMMLVQQQLHDGEMTAAAVTLRPVAFAPHGGWLSERADTIIARINAGAGPEASDELLFLLNAPPPIEIPAFDVGDGAD